MTSQKQIEANRCNAQESSGPKTSRGKSLSKMNALKHGLLAEQVVIPGEDFEKFDTLRQNLDAEFEPQGALEESLVERITMSLWRLRRCYGIEAGIFVYRRRFRTWKRASDKVSQMEDEAEPTSLNVGEPKNDKIFTAAKRKQSKAWEELNESIPVLGEDFGESERWLGALSRYEVAFERSLYRAMHELQRLQAERKAGDGGGSIIDVSVNENLPAAVNET